MSYKNPSRKQSPRLSTPVRLGVAAVAACFLSAPALSLPLNPAVVNGAASFNQAGKVLTVTNTPGAIINWQKFSIQAGETTHFAQTSASSSVLNRVLNDPSAIYGTLSSNGRVWLVNPAGIMVGPGGKVDVAAFVASTLNISNADFLAGRNVFINDGGAGNVINQGEIRTPAGGSVYLIGSNVSNEGIITTPKGETILAAGATVSLIDSATPGVKVDITGAEGNATNLGTLTAEAGRIGIAGVIVRNSGTVNASSVVSEGGRVFLKASQDAYVDGSGRIVTTGTKGGSVEVLGNRVAVMGTAEIDASGANGGGKILVGGDYQGKNPDVQNANITYFGPDATLKADATEVGDGGTVIVWADDTTRAYGNISARGGAAGGDGGFVETSGKRYLAVDGIHVDTRAPQGRVGNWLLDPSDITIYGGTGGITNGAFDVYGSFTTLAGYGSSSIYANTINSQLFTTDVTIQTDAGTGTTNSGNITANGVTIYGGVGSYSLALAAYGGGGGAAGTTGSITITNSNIDVYDGVSLLAGWNGASFAPGEISFTSDNVISGTGDINISGSSIRSANPAVKTNLFAGHDINLSSYGGAGTWVQGAMMDVFAGNNLTLTGGGGTITSSQGPGVMLRGDTEQKIKVVNQILLQAGSVNNTVYAGSPMYGGAVAIQSGGDQEIEAISLKIIAGAQGHDNSATVEAYGSQFITLGKSGSPGQLFITGGGDNTPTYGGTTVYGGVGSYNNFAELRQNSPTGHQVINLVSAGSSVQVKAGDGTGYGGYYNMGEPAGAGWSSNNFAAIHNQGDGSAYGGGFGQVIDFHYGGTLTVTGGSAGNSNFASIGNWGEGKVVIGSINAVDTATALANLPAITLTGGASGGMDFGGGGDNLSNSADIYSEAVSALADIGGSSITIMGGGDATTIGGAGFGANNLLLRTPSNLTLTGGGSNLVTSFPIPGAATAAFIGNDDIGNTSITIEAGGNISLAAGAGYGGAVFIGTVDGGPLTTIDIGAYGGITLASGPSSSVIIGNVAPGGYGGVNVSLTSMGGLTATGTDNAPVRIGSLNDGPTNVLLGSMRNVTLNRTNVGSLYGGATSIAVYGGFMENGSPSPYGGDLNFTRTKLASAYGDAAIALYAAYGGAGTGNISFSNGGGAVGASLDIVADRDLTLTAGDKGVRLQTTTGPMAIKADNFFAYGGDVVRPAGDINLIGQPVGNSGAQISVLAGSAGQTIEVANTLLLKAGNVDNPYGGNSSYYGGAVTVNSAGTQTITAGGMTLQAGASGHDNSVTVTSYGSQTINVYGGGLTLMGGGTTGSYNNQARIEHGSWQYGGTGVQTVNIYGGGSVVITAGSGDGTLGYYDQDCALVIDVATCRGSSNAAEIHNIAGSQALNFATGGSLTITGGSVGSDNWAGIENEAHTGSTQSITGNPDITLNGGSSGGKGVGSPGDDFDLTNDAGIHNEGYGGQTITAGTFLINGGNATYGGAGISNDGPVGAVTITTTGDMSMYGGTSNAVHPYASPVFIHNEYDVPMTLTVGGKLHVESGSGSSTPAIIGSVVASASVSISAGGNIDFIDNGGGVTIGSYSAYGANVSINAGDNINISGGATGVLIGSVSDLLGSTSVLLSAGKGITATGTAEGVWLGVGDLTGAYGSSVALNAGWNAGSAMPSGYGGDITLSGPVYIQTDGASGTIDIFANESSAGAYGSVSIGAGTIAYGGSIDIIAGGNLDVNGSLISSGEIRLDAGWNSYGGGATLRGGNLTLGSTSNLQMAYGNLYAQAGTSTPYGGGNITQSGSLAASGNIMLLADRDITVNGSVTSSSGRIDLDAGYSETQQFGGNILVSGTISGEYGVNLIAEAGSLTGLNGNITQSAGSIVAGFGTVSIIGGGDVNLNGSIDGGEGSFSTAISVKAGFSGYGGTITPYGGNISLAGTSAISGYGGVFLYAESGSASGTKGDITQLNSGTVTADSGEVRIIGGGTVTLNGSVSAYGSSIGGSGLVRAGISAYDGMATPNGGNISISGNVFGDSISSYGIGLFASAGSSSDANGNITQYAGSIISTADGSNIMIVSAGNTTLNGTVSSGYQTMIGAGFDPGTNLASTYGGGIAFNAGSLIEARNGVDGTAINAITYGGDITQAPSSQLIARSYGDITVLAYGDARMDGTTTVTDAVGYGVYVAAGAANAFGLSSSFGNGVRAGSSNIVAINRFDAAYGGVGVQAAGGILRSTSSASGSTNIVADTVDLVSFYGGSSNQLAISAITEATGVISASVSASASYGGISIINLGNQPASGLSLADYATNPGMGLNGGPASISFYNAGDLALGGGTTFDSTNSGDIAIISGGNLVYSGGVSAGSGGVLLGAGGDLTMAGYLGVSGNLGLAAGGTMNINDGLTGSNVTLVAPTINITGGYVYADGTASVNGSTINITNGGYVGGYAFTSITGTTINIDGGFVGSYGNTSVIGSTISIMNGDVVGANVGISGPSPGTGDLILATGGIVSADSGELTFNLANVTSYGGGLVANGPTGNITGTVSGNITLDNGAYFKAGDDIKLILASSNSEVSLSNGSYMLADTVTQVVGTIYLDFLTRESGGVMIDGAASTTSPSSSGSGFFVMNSSTPATTTPGGGLVITYANSIVVDPCASSPDLCELPAPIDNPVIEIVETDPCAAAPDSAQCKALKLADEKENKEDQFGDEENGTKDGKSSQKKLAQCGV